MKQVRAYIAATSLVLFTVLAAGIWQPDHSDHRSGLSAVCRTHQCACSLAQRCEINCCCQQGSASILVVQDSQNPGGKQQQPELRNSDCKPFQGLGFGLFRLPNVVFPHIPTMAALTAAVPARFSYGARIFWIDSDPLEKIPIAAPFLHI